MPVFSREQDLQTITLIMRLYNQINQEVIDGNPKLPAGANLDPQLVNNFRPGSVLRDWSYGFKWGLNLTMDIWDGIPLEEMELENDVALAWMACSYFADEKLAKKILSKNRKITLEQFAGDVRSDLPYIIKDYAGITRSLYKTFLETRSVSPRNLLADGDNEIDELLDDAYEEENPALQRQLFKKILQLDSECSEALIGLSEISSSPKEQIALLEQALAIEEKKLGKNFFAKNTGLFWEIYETRVYMRALTGLANAHRDNKQPAKAIEYLEQSLHLNPNDNLGNRYVLLSLYLENQKMRDVENLLETYKEDNSAFTRFSRALLSYIQEGDSARSRKLRKQANASNKFVAKYLSNRLSMPKVHPEYYGNGDKDEAIFVTLLFKDAWRQTVGAIPWLLKND